MPKYNRRYPPKRPEPLFQEAPKQRKCMKCQGVFISVDGRRICLECSRINDRCARRVDNGMGLGHGPSNKVDVA